MNKLKKGDQVIVIAGKDKGRKGAVLRLLEADRVLVEGVNIAKKHVKPDPNKNISGGIVDKEKPLHVSNIMLFNPQTKKGDRVGIKFVGEGAERKKVRFFKSNDELVDA
ncbi:MAG: 50S ribosomal protein L24 [Nevskiales bacterium]